MRRRRHLSGNCLQVVHLACENTGFPFSHWTKWTRRRTYCCFFRGMTIAWAPQDPILIFVTIICAKSTHVKPSVPRSAAFFFNLNKLKNWQTDVFTPEDHSLQIYVIFCSKSSRTWSSVPRTAIGRRLVNLFRPFCSIYPRPHPGMASAIAIQPKIHYPLAAPDRRRRFIHPTIQHTCIRQDLYRTNKTRSKKGNQEEARTTQVQVEASRIRPSCNVWNVYTHEAQSSKTAAEALLLKRVWPSSICALCFQVVSFPGCCGEPKKSLRPSHRIAASEERSEFLIYFCFFLFIPRKPSQEGRRTATRCNNDHQKRRRTCSPYRMIKYDSN